MNCSELSGIVYEGVPTRIRVDEGAATESTMSVGCGLRWRARGVSALHRSQLPTLLDDVCSPAPCRPRSAPRAPHPLAPRPSAFTTRLPVIHIHSLPVYRRCLLHRQHLVFWQAPHIFTHYYFNKLKVRSKAPRRLPFIAPCLCTNLDVRC